MATRARSVADFPDPPRFGIWWAESYFSIHPSLSAVKGNITSSTGANDQLRRDAKVYEFIDGHWELIYDMPKDSIRSDHELWKNGPAPKTAALSDAAVQAAIDSIKGGP